MSAEEDIHEILSRCRRMETRLTRGLEALGVNTEAQKPIWNAADGSVHIPSLYASIKDIKAVIPADYIEKIDDVPIKYSGETIYVLTDAEG